MTRSGLSRVLAGIGVRNAWIRFGRLSRWGLILFALGTDRHCEPEAADEYDHRDSEASRAGAMSLRGNAPAETLVQRFDPQEDVGCAGHRQPRTRHRPATCGAAWRASDRTKRRRQSGRQPAASHTASQAAKCAAQMRQTKGWNQKEDRPEMQDHVPDQVVTATWATSWARMARRSAVGLFAVRFRQQKPRLKQAGQAGCGDFRRLDDTNGLTAAERRRRRGTPR